MTTTPPDAPTGPAGPTPGPGDPHGPQGPRVTHDEIRDLGRLRRSATDRKVAGVAGGLARHLDIDPLVLRVAFVVLAFFGGAGLLLYGACWLLVPEEHSGEAPVTLDERSRTIALLVVGVLAVFALLGDSWGVYSFPWPVAIIALVVLLLMTRRDREQPPPGSGGAPHPPVTPPVAGTTTDPATGAPATPAYQSWTQSQPYAQASYGQSHYGPGPYAQDLGPVVPPTYPAYAPRPRDPRRRGPVLFWFTLALVATGVGVLGLVDVAGLGVADSAYPALATAIIGVMLVVGAVWGRAGGLIALGLVAALGMAAATAAGNFDGETLHETPTTAAEVQDSYEFGAGEIVLDLTGVTDLEELDGRAIRIEGGIGEVEVLLPDGVDLRFEGRVGGPGSVEWFGQERGGIATEVIRTRDDGDVDLAIDAQLGVGTITVDEE